MAVLRLLSGPLFLTYTSSSDLSTISGVDCAEQNKDSSAPFACTLHDIHNGAIFVSRAGPPVAPGSSQLRHHPLVSTMALSDSPFRVCLKKYHHFSTTSYIEQVSPVCSSINSSPVTRLTSWVELTLTPPDCQSLLVISRASLQPVQHLADCITSSTCHWTGGVFSLGVAIIAGA
ncbi:hypothetical protein ASPSYDRAFT_42787 [Aspergillus sydowii CBS 593.65]|uniref:Ig-like domain-containing protein n=1 Tax=Aspergillus sydowii CBS 593.65 TaxID=1036612 RepID=A0A1L9TNF6_9EURO|nr:uncharacterized protein ASPSYDRAFT_42787 [Aspergillus sydowii CBS 593.65]OJJ60957.1 hypothetical protein ASPSYDRAFT_42787 [Aspergillus sydowii CBS 593.65]